MTFQDFITKYNGQYVDFDGVYGAQCMDLLHIYCVEVLGITDGSVLASPTAADVYDNFPSVNGHDLFDQTANSPTGVPQEGDIMFWGTAPSGHVAIFISGDQNNFTSFDQNYPTGSPCHAQAHTYANVLGWLRYKGTNTNQTILNQSDAFIWGCTTLNIAANPDLFKAELNKLIAIEDAAPQKDKQLSDAQSQITFLQQQMAALQVQHDALQKQIDDQSKTIDTQDAQIQTLDQNIKDLQTQLNKPVLTGWKLFIFKLISQ